jgi:hypothetical protein
LVEELRGELAGLTEADGSALDAYSIPAYAREVLAIRKTVDGLKIQRAIRERRPPRCTHNRSRAGSRIPCGKLEDSSQAGPAGHDLGEF